MMVQIVTIGHLSFSFLFLIYCTLNDQRKWSKRMLLLPNLKLFM